MLGDPPGRSGSVNCSTTRSNYWSWLSVFHARLSVTSLQLTPPTRRSPWRLHVLKEIFLFKIELATEMSVRENQTFSCSARLNTPPPETATLSFEAYLSVGSSGFLPILSSIVLWLPFIMDPGSRLNEVPLHSITLKHTGGVQMSCQALNSIRLNFADVPHLWKMFSFNVFN